MAATVHATGGGGSWGRGEHPEIIWTFAFCLQPVRGLPAREGSEDNGLLDRPGRCPPTVRKLSFNRISQF